MKYSIDISRLLKLIRNKFDVPLSPDSITRVESWYDLPTVFSNELSMRTVNNLLNNLGPMYALNYNDNNYLVINDDDLSSNETILYDKNGTILVTSFFKLMNSLGLSVLGLNKQSFINILDHIVETEKL